MRSFRVPARWSLLPPEATSDAALLLKARGVRAFADGFISVLLGFYLTTLGLSGVQVGAIITATLVGSAVLTLVVGLAAYRMGRRVLLLRASALMIATVLAFALAQSFWPLLLAAFAGTLNPSSGDVSVFLPTEQALLPQTVSADERTTLFARHAMVGSLIAAIGSLCAGLPEYIAGRFSIELERALQGMFILYALLGGVSLVIYRGLSPTIEPQNDAPPTPLRESRRIVYRLAALFSLDAFGGGFVVQSLLALWLFRKFELSLSTAGTIFFWTGVLAAFSFLVSAKLAERIGLVNTMVFTHLPSNLFLILTPLMPTLPLAIICLFARSALSSMDVPARNSYVMAVVTPAERPAAASVTAVPRSLAAALSPVLSGFLLGLSTFGWPLVVAGTFKCAYDLLLLRMFRSVRPPEEETRDRGP